MTTVFLPSGNIWGKTVGQFRDSSAQKNEKKKKTGHGQEGGCVTASGNGFTFNFVVEEL